MAETQWNFHLENDFLKPEVKTFPVYFGSFSKKMLTEPQKIIYWGNSVRRVQIWPSKLDISPELPVSEPIPAEVAITLLMYFDINRKKKCVIPMRYTVLEVIFEFYV